MRPASVAGWAAALASAWAGRGAAAAEDGPRPPGKPVVYAWFPANFTDLDTRAVDWSALTHLCIRSVTLRPDGTLDEPQKANQARLRQVVDEAHRHGVKATVLAWGTDAAGSSRSLAENAERAARSLLDYVAANGLDGAKEPPETFRLIRRHLLGKAPGAAPGPR